MEISVGQWIRELDQKEAAYARQCFRFWNGTNGSQEPEIPEGMSKVHADVLKYHTKSFINGDTRRKRKMEDLKVVSFKMPPREFEELASCAAQVDVNVSIFIRCCIELASPQVLKNPALINFFSESVIPK